MGLDMYLLKLSKVDESETQKRNVDDLKCSYYLKNKSSARALRDVMPWVTEAVMLVSRPDEKIIRKEFNIPDKMEFIALCDGPYEHIYTYGTEDCSTVLEARFPTEELDKYSSEKETEVYLFKEEIVGYWYKDYGLSAEVIDVLDEPYENSKLYPLTEKMRNVIRKRAVYLPVANDSCCGYSELETDSPDSVICYMQWR